jgi:nitrogen fixation protein FixH
MTTQQPRSLWPFALVGFFLALGTYLVVFVSLAVRHHDDLVSADYYEKEVRYQKQIDTMTRSSALALQSVVTFDPAQQAIVINLPDAAVPGASGHVHLYRPSDARLDRDVPLTLNAEGVQRLDAKELRGGLWKVRLNWTANGQEYYLDRSVLVTSG